MWMKREGLSRSTAPVSISSAEYDRTKMELAPKLEKAAAEKPRFIPLELHPVRGPDLFEGEFGRRGDDVIMHIWPDGYRKAEELRRAKPPFHTGFERGLKNALATAFELGTIEYEFTKEMGAYFILIKGAGTNPMHYDACVRTFRKLYEFFSPPPAKE